MKHYKVLKLVFQENLTNYIKHLKKKDLMMKKF